MTDSNIIKITAEKDIAIMSFNVANLAAGQVLDETSQIFSDFIKNNKPQCIIVDFASVKFFSSQMLGILIDARKKLSAAGGNVAISGINPQLYRVLKITNLDKIFRFYPDVKTARRELKKQD